MCSQFVSGWCCCALCVLVWPSIAGSQEIPAGDPVDAHKQLIAAAVTNEAQVRRELVERSIRRALDSTTDFDFIETPLADVMAYLEHTHDIQVKLDHRSTSAIGVGPETPITGYLRDTPLESALRIVLRELDLTTVVVDGVLLITTEEFAQTRKFTLIDSIDDLAPDEESTQQLLQTVELALDKDLDNESPSQMAIFRGQLVVRGPQRQLQEVSQLLAMLRSKLGVDRAHSAHPLARWRLGKSADLSSLPLTSEDLFLLGHQAHLEALDLSRSKIQDAGLTHLSQLAGLTRLNLSGTGITDAGVSHLTELKQLEVLDISDTLVTDKGLRQLAGMQQLRQLTLGNSVAIEPRITKPAVEHLEAALPDCAIIVRRPRAAPVSPGAAPFSELP